MLEEQRILTSQYMEISTKYKSLIQTLDEQWNKIHEAKIKQLDTLNNTYNERLEEARKEYQQFTDSLYQEFETLSQQLHPLKTEKLSELNAMDYQIKLARPSRNRLANRSHPSQSLLPFTRLDPLKKPQERCPCTADRARPQPRRGHHTSTSIMRRMIHHASRFKARATATLPAPTGVARPALKSPESSVSRPTIATGMRATKRADIRA